MKLKDRLDIGQVILLVAAMAFMGYLLKYGPESQRGVIYAAAVGLVTTLAAALQGRLVKRTPEKALAKAAHTAGAKTEKAVVDAVVDVEDEPVSKPETD
jgi:hypothetical protein